MLRFGSGDKRVRDFPVLVAAHAPILAVSSWCSALVGGSYECGLVIENAVLEPSEIQAQDSSANFAGWRGIAGQAFLSDLIFPIAIVDTFSRFSPGNT